MISDAERIEHRVHDEVHDCIVPECGTRARTAFLAAGDGRFASREIRAGEFIDLCAPHGHDVYQAQHQPYKDWPGWLQADAKPGPLYGLFDTLEGL